MSSEYNLFDRFSFINFIALPFIAVTKTIKNNHPSTEEFKKKEQLVADILFLTTISNDFYSLPQTYLIDFALTTAHTLQEEIDLSLLEEDYRYNLHLALLKIAQGMLNHVLFLNYQNLKKLYDILIYAKKLGEKTNNDNHFECNKNLAWLQQQIIALDYALATNAFGLPIPNVLAKKATKEIFVSPLTPILLLVKENPLQLTPPPFISISTGSTVNTTDAMPLAVAHLAMALFILEQELSTLKTNSSQATIESFNQKYKNFSEYFGKIIEIFFKTPTKNHHNNSYFTIIYLVSYVIFTHLTMIDFRLINLIPEKQFNLLKEYYLVTFTVQEKAAIEDKIKTYFIIPQSTNTHQLLPIHLIAKENKKIDCSFHSTPLVSAGPEIGSDIKVISHYLEKILETPENFSFEEIESFLKKIEKDQFLLERQLPLQIKTSVPFLYHILAIKKLNTLFDADCLKESAELIQKAAKIAIQHANLDINIAHDFILITELCNFFILLDKQNKKNIETTLKKITQNNKINLKTHFIYSSAIKFFIGQHKKEFIANVFKNYFNPHQGKDLFYPIIFAPLVKNVDIELLKPEDIQAKQGFLNLTASTYSALFINTNKPLTHQTNKFILLLCYLQTLSVYLWEDKELFSPIEIETIKNNLMEIFTANEHKIINRIALCYLLRGQENNYNPIMIIRDYYEKKQKKLSILPPSLPKLVAKQSQQKTEVKKAAITAENSSNISENSETKEKTSENSFPDNANVLSTVLPAQKITLEHVATALTQAITTLTPKTGKIIGPKIAGLTFQEIDGDGNCFYNAVALHTDKNQQQLRDLVADTLEKKWDRDIHSYLLSRGETKKNYIDKIRQNAWADNTEIAELIMILKRPIVIIGPQGEVKNRTDLVEETTNRSRFSGVPIFIFYNGHNHYDTYLVNENADVNKIYSALTNISIHSHSVTKKDNENPPELKLSKNTEETKPHAKNLPSQQQNTPPSNIAKLDKDLVKPAQVQKNISPQPSATDNEKVNLSARKKEKTISSDSKKLSYTQVSSSRENHTLTKMAFFKEKHSLNDTKNLINVDQTRKNLPPKNNPPKIKQNSSANKLEKLPLSPTASNSTPSAPKNDVISTDNLKTQPQKQSNPLPSSVTTTNTQLLPAKEIKPVEISSALKFMQQWLAPINLDALDKKEEKTNETLVKDSLLTTAATLSSHTPSIMHPVTPSPTTAAIISPNEITAKKETSASIIIGPPSSPAIIIDSTTSTQQPSSINSALSEEQSSFISTPSLPIRENHHTTALKEEYALNKLLKKGKEHHIQRVNNAEILLTQPHKLNLTTLHTLLNDFMSVKKILSKNFIPLSPDSLKKTFELLLDFRILFITFLIIKRASLENLALEEKILTTHQEWNQKTKNYNPNTIYFYIFYRTTMQMYFILKNNEENKKSFDILINNFSQIEDQYTEYQSDSAEYKAHSGYCDYLGHQLLMTAGLLMLRTAEALYLLYVGIKIKYPTIEAPDCITVLSTLKNYTLYNALSLFSKFYRIALKMPKTYQKNNFNELTLTMAKFSYAIMKKFMIESTKSPYILDRFMPLDYKKLCEQEKTIDEWLSKTLDKNASAVTLINKKIENYLSMVENTAQLINHRPRSLLLIILQDHAQVLGQFMPLTSEQQCTIYVHSRSLTVPYFYVAGVLPSEQTINRPYSIHPVNNEEALSISSYPQPLTPNYSFLADHYPLENAAANPPLYFPAPLVQTVTSPSPQKNMRKNKKGAKPVSNKNNTKKQGFFKPKAPSANFSPRQKKPTVPISYSAAVQQNPNLADKKQSPDLSSASQTSGPTPNLGGKPQ